MPLIIYILSLAIFSVTTSELMIAGMLPSLTQAFNASVADIGYLISLYALGMVIGGPILTVGVLKFKLSNKNGLLWLLGIYVISQIISATAINYDVMAVSRVIAGVVASACFGIALAISADIVAIGSRGRAASIVVSGLMFATVIGVPLVTIIDQYIGWRAIFWLVAILTTLCALIIAKKVSNRPNVKTASLRAELYEFKKGSLWAAYATSGLVLGATFAAFSYLFPILTQLTHFKATTMPLLFGCYGAACVVANIIVGRYFADRYTIITVIFGLFLLAASLLLFALFTDNKIIAFSALIMIGLTGLPMNPALITRVMNVAHPGPLVNTVHTSVINVGLALGTWLGGLGIATGYGEKSPLWIGFILACLGLISILPFLKTHRYPYAKINAQ